MKKRMDYTMVFRRRNLIKETLYNLFFALCSWPRLLLEVFTRKRFGERYFSFSGAILMTVVLAFLPPVIASGLHMFRQDWGLMKFLWVYATWYVFLAGFVYMCLKRREEIRRLPSVFDFARYSLSTGIIDPRFFTIKIFGRTPTVREVCMILEPGLFFVIGLGLSMLGQALGGLLIQCSIWYALSYKASFYLADEEVMSQIDKIIAQEEWTRSFVEGLDASQTRGFSYMGRRPADREQRQRVADAFMETEETVEAF